MDFQWSREQKVEPGSGKHKVYTYLPKDPNSDICLKKITRASCRTRTDTVVPRAEHFVDLITAEHKILWKVWIANQSSICRGGTRFGNSVDTIIPMWNNNFSGDPEEPDEVPGADEETKSHLHWRLPGIWKILRGIIVSQHHTEQKQMGLQEGSQSERKNIWSVVAISSGECMVSGFHGMLLLSAKHSRSLVWRERHHMKDGWECPFNGPMIPFGAMDEDHPISAKTHRNYINLVQKFC